MPTRHFQETVRLSPAGLPRLALPALCALAVTASSAAALADELHVPRDYFHLEAAAAAAQPGDTIVLHGEARIREIRSRTDPVVLPANVTLRGGRLADDVTLIANELTLRRVGLRKVLRIEGDGTSLVACSGRSTSVDLVGDGARVERLRVRGAATSSSRVRVHGDDALLEGLAGTIGIEVDGDRAHVSGSRLVTGGIRVVGDDATIAGNRTSRTRGRISVVGDRAVIRRNRVGPWAKAVGAIWVNGGDADVSGNRVRSFRSGIQVLSTDVGGAPSRIEDNVVRLSSVAPNEWFGLNGIRVVCDTPGTVVTGNRIRVMSRDGIHVEAPGATIQDNSVVVRQHRATRHDRGNGITSLGRGCTIDGNDVFVVNHQSRQFFTGHGFRIVGTEWTVTDNVVLHAAEHGFVLDGDGVATGNRVRGARGHGVAVVGSGPVTVQSSVVESCGQEGVFATAPGTVLDDVRVRRAKGAGVFVHPDAPGSALGLVDVSGCRRGGLVNEAADLTVSGSTLLGNNPGDLVDLVVPLELTNTEVGTRTSDPRLAPRGREEWLVDHPARTTPWAGFKLWFTVAGAGDGGTDVPVELRPDRYVALRSGQQVGSPVVARLSADQFDAIWAFAAGHDVPLPRPGLKTSFPEGLTVIGKLSLTSNPDLASHPDVAEWLALIQQHVRAQIAAGVTR